MSSSVPILTNVSSTYDLAATFTPAAYPVTVPNFGFSSLPPPYQFAGALAVVPTTLDALGVANPAPVWSAALTAAPNATGTPMVAQALQLANTVSATNGPAATILANRGALNAFSAVVYDSGVGGVPPTLRLTVVDAVNAAVYWSEYLVFEGSSGHYQARVSMTGLSIANPNGLTISIDAAPSVHQFQTINIALTVN